MKTQASLASQVVYGVHAVRELIEQRPTEIQSMFYALGSETPSDAIARVLAAAPRKQHIVNREGSLGVSCEA